MRLWLCRDKIGTLRILEGKPIYSNGTWHTRIPIPSEKIVIISEGLLIPMDVFPEVTFSNSPQQIEIALSGNQTGS